MKSTESNTQHGSESSYDFSPHGENHTLITSRKTGAKRIVNNEPLNLPEIDTDEHPEKGRYAASERKHFIQVLGPGAAVALESLRKRVGTRLKVTRHGRGRAGLLDE
jgi:hypothetical protein